MSNNKSKKHNLTPEEQVNLHLAMRGNNTDFESQPEQEPSEYNFYEDDFRRFLEQGKASVSLAELSPDLFTKNDFFFEEADKPYRGWKLDKVTFTDSSCTPETITLEFARFCSDREERITKPLSDLSDDNLIRVDDLMEEVNDHLTDIDDVTEEAEDDDEYSDYDDYITDIDDEPVFGALEYALATHQIVGSKIAEAYDRILSQGIFINDGDDDIRTMIPIDAVFDTVSDNDDRNPEIYEYVAVTRLRDSGKMAVLGHRYAERNSRRRKTEQVYPLDMISSGTVIKILGRLERYFDEDVLDEDVLDDDE